MSEFRQARRPPVILLGMHRSGTSMITKFLEELGLYIGAELDDNHESLFFFKLNHWMFRVGTSKTDYPLNMLSMSGPCKAELARAVDYHLGHSMKKLYLGSRRESDIRDLDIPWGWKEPRNTFTLDIYRRLFPEARIIHIYRNPLDASVSYIKRDIERRNHFALTWKKRLKRRFLIAHKYHQNFRLQTLQDGFDLWKEYVGAALAWNDSFGDHIRVYRYEDFLDAPFAPMKDMAAFCGLEVSDDRIRDVVRGVDASRKYAFLDDEEAVAFYETVRRDELMVRLGYGDIRP